MIIIILVDLSGSMEHAAGITGQTRRDMASKALTGVMSRHPDVHIYAFNDDVQRVLEPRELPPAIGGTDLAGALKHLRAVRPDKLIVISDGEPNDAQSALTAALMLMTEISTIFCGDESNRNAIRFLNDLKAASRKGAVGRSKVMSLEKPEAVTEEILQLTGPSH